MFVYDYSPQNVIWSHVDTEKLHTERYYYNCLNMHNLQQLTVAHPATTVFYHSTHYHMHPYGAPCSVFAACDAVHTSTD
jgi:hypothetical protein